MAAKRAARSMRSGSSPKESAERVRRLDDPGGQVVQSPERVREVVAGQADRHRVDREVPAAQVVQQVVAVAHDRVAGQPVVGLGPERGDLEPQAVLQDPDRAEVPAGLPDPVGPALDQRERLLRQGVGAEVEVVAEPSEQSVPHRPADEVQLMVGGAETAPQLIGDG
nr:hypothetical protein GCM10020092_002580 [Actinoplanes digitatis]